MDNIYKNIEDHNPNKKPKILIVFQDIFADLLNNKKRNPIVTELFIRAKKVNISLVFITQSCFAVPKNVRLSLPTILLRTFQTNENFSIFRLIIYQILTLKTL